MHDSANMNSEILIHETNDELSKDFGNGFSSRQLAFCRQFYAAFPIANALRSQLNWTQHRLLIRIEDKDKQSYYIEEACKNNWSIYKQIPALPAYKRKIEEKTKPGLIWRQC